MQLKVLGPRNVAPSPASSSAAAAAAAAAAVPSNTSSPSSSSPSSSTSTSEENNNNNNNNNNNRRPSPTGNNGYQYLRLTIEPTKDILVANTVLCLAVRCGDGDRDRDKPPMSFKTSNEGREGLVGMCDDVHEAEVSDYQTIKP